MLDPDLLDFVVAALPPAPARVLEVGAGEGELASALSAAGHDLVAIDPASNVDHVRAIPLAELREPPASFDAAVSVVALHHVDPLVQSCRHLAELVSPGAPLILDEIDVERCDERAASWFLENRPPDDHGLPGPAEIVATLRDHCHSLATMQDALARWFALGEPVRGPYLYRWALRLDLRSAEQELIATGELPVVGVRILGTRRPDPA